MTTEINVEDLQKKWEKFDGLCRRLSDHGLNQLLDDMGQRLVVCPASTKLDQYGASPGGMIDHVLSVTTAMRKLNSAMEWQLPIASIIKVGLLHDLGKVGDLENDYFVEQTSDWHREKLGQMYKFNEDLNKMAVSHRTLWLLQNYGVQLSNDEWLAIQLAQGSHFEENRFYVGHEPTLALALQTAKRLVINDK